MKGLFLNTKKANCSIHESGKMCFDCIKLSDKFTLDYQEIHESAREVSSAYDFYVFNYHQVTMGWLDTSFVKSLPGKKFTIVLEVLPNDPFVMCPRDHFDGYIVLDPTLKMNQDNVYSFPRPLEVTEINNNSKYNPEITTIGTFGFATKGKGYEKVIDAVNKEFEQALIRINIPKGDYVTEDVFDSYVQKLKDFPRKKEIQLEITHEYYEKNELIKWCSENTLNVFLYNRNMPGLSATTDQAIVSGKPMAISADVTFRHIHQYLTPYPFQTLKESINGSLEKMEILKNEWAPLKFTQRFEKVLIANRMEGGVLKNGTFTLPVKRTIKSNSISLTDFFPPIATRVVKKALRKIRNNPNAIPFRTVAKINTLTPFIHPALNSFSQHGEDLFLDLMFNYKTTGFYLDVGANDPYFNSNTYRFYKKGWTGVNIEPNRLAFERIKAVRINDINLNLAISETEGELSFYELFNDSTLSTLDYNTALKMSKLLDLPIVEKKIETKTLANIFELSVPQPVDFLSIDAEGHDYNVLKSNNWNKYRPSLILIESNNDFERIKEYMTQVDYFHIYNNLYNSIYIDVYSKDNPLVDKISFN